MLEQLGMSDEHISNLLQKLESGDSDSGWAEFLEQFASPIFAVVHCFESDADDVSDCFQYVCEQLVADRFRRLRKFKPKGPAKFSTWLRAVVRNLCLDWRRKQVGRQRIFRSVSRLSFFDQEVFRLVYERGNTNEESLLMLGTKFPRLTETHLTESRARIEKELTANQRWLLTKRVAQTTSTIGSTLDEPEAPAREIADFHPNPEEQALQNESRTKLRSLLRGLNSRERLLLRMRFEQELTLEQCAKLVGLGNAQRVDRQLKEILARLRNDMNS